LSKRKRTTAKPKPNDGSELSSTITDTALSTAFEMDDAQEADHKAAQAEGKLLMLPLDCNTADEQY
jgi:hypothetical protein